MEKSMPSAAFHWLGPPKIEIEGRPVSLETRKTTALLAILSVDQKPHSRERIAALLWPDFGYHRAPANLRRVLSSLQASLGKDWVQADRETISLRGGQSILIDFDTVLHLVRAVRAHHPEQDLGLCGSCIEMLEEAAGLYRGDFLEGFNLKDCPGFDQWQMEKRDELYNEMSWALECLTEAMSEADRWEDAITVARRWLSLDELHEPAHRTLMFLYAKSGKRSAAVHQYNECVRLLGQELGQEPDDSTQSLFECIRLRKLETSRQEPKVNTAPVRSDRAVNKPSEAPKDEARLSTRLKPPPGRPVLVERSRLLSLMNEGTRRPVTLLSAPAGFGKTTLLADWARGCGLPVAWLSLDEADSEAGHFFTSFAAALRRLGPDIGAEASQMLHAIQTPPLSAVTDSLLDDLARFREEMVLVIDDLHLTDSPEVDSFINGLVQNTPENLHLYIATRIDPALPLARMRARAQLVEIRAEELRFMQEEAASFLKHVMGLDLRKEDIVLLERRTEGWAAGLQMAALSLQRCDDHSAFIKKFGGSHRYIMDYLVEEVLRGQPAEMQDFLLRTSILDRFRSGLCDAVSGRTGSQSILETLDQENLFVVALDEERTWYRYHHLFADLLHHRLDLKFEPGEIAELHLRAGSWLEKANDVEGAMRHYISGGQFDAALHLIYDRYVAVLTRGGLRMLLGWATEIPEQAVLRDAGGCIAVGSIYVFAGRAAEAQRFFAQADTLLETSGARTEPKMTDALRGETSVMRAFIAEIAGQTAMSIELAEKADELLPAERVMTRSLIPYILSRAYRHQGDLDRAEACLDRQIGLARAAHNTWSLAGGIHEMVWICRLRGRLREAERLLDDFEEIAREPGTAGPIAKLIAARAEIERERGNLERAAAIAGESIKAVTRWGLPADMCFCLQTRLRIALSSGQVEAAADDLAEIDKIVRTSQVFANLIPLYEAERARILIARGMDPQAIAWLTEYRYPEKGNPVNREVISIARARVLISAGRGDEACELLDALAAEAEATGRIGRLIETLVLRAAAGNGRTCDEALLRALELAGPEGYVRIFLDEGEPVLHRLHGLTASSGETAQHLADYARHIVSFVSF
jgi:LuxR family transcriptional regulator, maltose regulon positive regulatory protein